MKLHRHNRLVPAAVAAAALALVLTACGSDDPVQGSSSDDQTSDASGASDSAEVSVLAGELSGAGASSQESAMNAWIAGFQTANPDVSIAYDPIGSGGGRTQFLTGGTQFGGTDSAFKDEEIAQAADRCYSGEHAELPLYISPFAVIFNLDGIDSLNMSPATIAGIFNQQITSWDDPAIVAENPDVDLPALDITPVNRSDESGTTENFTDYLAATAGDAWPYEASGDWPVPGGQSAQGTSGVVQTVADGQGTIGYADASKVGSLGSVAVKVGDAYVPFSPEAAAAVVDASPRAEGRPAASLVVELDRTTTAAGAYPLVLISYSMICTGYEDPVEAELVQAFMSYVASPEGQEQAATAAGSAPISDQLRAEVQEILDGIA